MAQTRMLGVVLWCDDVRKKAVIWCEDHGQLAYYSQREAKMHEGVGSGLGAGDLIRFDLTEEAHLRFAHNPVVLDELAYPSLADTLIASHSNEKRAASAPPRRPAPANSDKVIPFHTARNQSLVASV